MPATGCIKPCVAKINGIAHTESEILTYLIKSPPATLEDHIFKFFKEIIYDAAMLEGAFVASRAIFEAEWPFLNGDTSFNAEEIESSAVSKATAARKFAPFAYQPLLRKTGNVDGQFYETSKVLVKAAVLYQENDEVNLGGDHQVDCTIVE